MIIVRTCGSGTNYNDERLKLLEKQVEYLKLETQIFKLHDHKGLLQVYWFTRPSTHEVNLINKLWEGYNEYSTSHFLIKINEYPI